LNAAVLEVRDIHAGDRRRSVRRPRLPEQTADAVMPTAGPIGVKANVGGSLDSKSVTAPLMAASPLKTPSGSVRTASDA
jgi:hypothetical protein